MPKKLNWVLLETFESSIGLEAYISAGSPMIYRRNEKNFCTLCINKDKHEMRYRRLFCGSKTCEEIGLCDFQKLKN